MTAQRFVIAGTGRSGTKWCATVLRTAGIACGHEQVYTTELLPHMGDPDWDWYEGDSSLAAVPYLRRHKDIRRVLVVRDPLATAGSFVHVGPFTEGSQPAGLLTFLEKAHASVLYAESALESALRYWVAWNTRALRDADAVARLEDLTPERLLDLVGHRERWPLYPFDEPVNASAQHGVKGDDLMEVPQKVLSAVENLARELGYEVPW